MVKEKGNDTNKNEFNIYHKLRKRSLPKVLNKNNVHKEILLTLLSDSYCAVCKKVKMIDYENNDLTKECRVEHHHEDNGRGRLRGLVCNRCNKIISDVDKKYEETTTYQCFMKLIKNISKSFAISCANLKDYWERTMPVPMDLELHLF